MEHSCHRYKMDLAGAMTFSVRHRSIGISIVSSSNSQCPAHAADRPDQRAVVLPARIAATPNRANV